MGTIKKKVENLKPGKEYLLTVRAKDNTTDAVSAYAQSIRFMVPEDETIPDPIGQLEIYVGFEKVMFVFNFSPDPDFARYEYELYATNSTSGTPVRTGFKSSNVFTVLVDNSYTDSNGDTVVKKYWGRIRVIDTSGNMSAWTALTPSVSDTPLIADQYIQDLTASKITAGTIGAHTITLSGATSIIKSSNYSAGSAGWQIDGSGSAEFASATIRGNIAGGTIDIGGSDGTSFHVNADGDMWLGAATFGSADFSVTNQGALTASNVTVTGGTISSGSYSYTSGNFSSSGMQIGLGSSGYIRAKNFAIDSSGDAYFKGSIEGGTIHIGGDDTSSFHVDETGDVWAGAGNSNKLIAPFYVRNTGKVSIGSGQYTVTAVSPSTPSTGKVTYTISGTHTFAAGADGEYITISGLAPSGYNISTPTVIESTATAGGNTTVVVSNATTGTVTDASGTLTSTGLFIDNDGAISIGTDFKTGPFQVSAIGKITAGTEPNLFQVFPTGKVEIGNTGGTRLFIGNDGAITIGTNYGTGPFKVSSAGAVQIGTSPNLFNVDTDGSVQIGNASSLTSGGIASYYSLGTLASDDFNRTDSATSLGGSWTAVRGTWGITSSQKAYLVSASGTLKPIATLNVGTGKANHQIEALISGGTVSAVDSYQGLVVRYVDENNYIFAVLSIVYGTWIVGKRVGGVDTLLGNTGISTTSNVTVLLAAYGSTVTIKVGTADPISFSVFDTALQSATRCGLCSYLSSTTGSSFTWDNVVVKEIALRSSLWISPTGSIQIGSSTSIGNFGVQANGQVDIGSGNPAYSFHVGVDGNLWSGAGPTEFDTAPLKVWNNGSIDIGGNDTSSLHISSIGDVHTGSAKTDFANAKFSIVASTGNTKISGSVTTGGNVIVGGTISGTNTHLNLTNVLRIDDTTVIGNRSLRGTTVTNIGGVLVGYNTGVNFIVNAESGFKGRINEEVVVQLGAEGLDYDANGNPTLASLLSTSSKAVLQLGSSTDGYTNKGLIRLYGRLAIGSTDGGTAAEPAIYFTADGGSNTGIFWNGENNLGFSTGGGLKLNVNTNGIQVTGSTTTTGNFSSSSTSSDLLLGNITTFSSTSSGSAGSAVYGNGKAQFWSNSGGAALVVQGDVLIKGTGGDTNASISSGGVITGATGSALTSGTYTAVWNGTGTNITLGRSSSSSIRYKEEVKPLTSSSLDSRRLLDIPVVEFRYKDGEIWEGDQRVGKQIPGFIAEEIYEKYPIACDLNEDGLPESWNDRMIIPPMLQLIQDLYKKVDELQEKLDSLN